MHIESKIYIPTLKDGNDLHEEILQFQYSWFRITFYLWTFFQYDKLFLKYILKREILSYDYKKFGTMNM